ncbi:MAG: phenylacetate--CoA ligase family protein, partial [Thermoplasmata archaeon]
MAHSLLPAGRHLKELSRTQWMKGEQIRAIQLKRLRSMLQHCYRTVPFYHRAMKDAGIYPQDVRSLDDLCRLPSVGKAEIRKAPFLFRSRRMPKGVFEESTSGSTAEPFRFLRSRRTYEWELGAQLRFFGWTGYRLGDRWAVIYRVSPFKSLREQFEDAARDVLLRRLRVNDWKISEEGLRRYAKRIFSFRPFLLVGLPKNLLEFGRFAHQENAGVPVLVSTMERIAPFERRLVNEMWGGEVYDMYGSAEARSVASECGEHDGLHISDELYVLEFVRDGEHVSPGEQGRILVTSLYH